MIRQVMSVVFAVLACSFSANTCFADENTQITLDENNVMNGITIEGGGVDDQLDCNLDGRDVLTTRFGINHFRWDLFGPSSKGQHTLKCKVTDNNGGSCYAYTLRILNGYNILKTMETSCCSSTCAKNGPIVLDETFTITIP